MEVLRRRPTWRTADGYFYFAPVGHIMCGFLCEKGSGGYYIWRYALPLYDRVRQLSLVFGERIAPPQGFMEFGSEPPVQLAESFLRRVEPYEAETLEWQMLEKFVQRASLSGRLRNPWARRAYAFTLIMLGRGEEGAKQLDAVAGGEPMLQLAGFAEEVAHVRKQLTMGIENARELLLSWEAETKARFELTS